MKIKKSLALSDSGFVFNASTGDSFSTNPIGLEILRYMNDGHDKNAIKAMISERYNIEPVWLEKDLLDFMATLNYLGLTEE
jgi:Coenzyme PQQ synthesis protein D (PqqD)